MKLHWWIWILIAIIGAFVLGIIDGMQNAHGQEAQFLEMPPELPQYLQDTAPKERSYAQGDIGEAFQQYCDRKVFIGMLSVKARDAGHTIDQVIESLQHYNRLPKDERVPRYQYLEYERMAREAFRKPDMTMDDLVREFYRDCNYLGF